MEIAAPLVVLAKAKVAAAGLSELVDLRHCAPGPLALDDASLEVVFSKDSLIHITDKDAAFRDYCRVLKPGGWLAMSDWMRGPEPYSKDMEYWFEMEGLSYHMRPLEFYAGALEAAGFGDIEVVDTSADYRALCDAEYAQMKGPLRDRMAAILGAETRDHFVENWRAMTVVLHKGELRTGRVRARKP
jgi:phosphoethanolamine N-methyltransferase